MAKQRGRQHRRGTAAGADGKGAPAAARKPCPFCRDKIDVVDYKDFGAAPRDQREGQDPLCPRHRLLPPAPDPARDRGQARPRARPPAVRRRPVGAMAQAILLKDVEHARRARRRRSTSPPATCATSWCRASSRSRPRRRDRRGQAAMEAAERPPRGRDDGRRRTPRCCRKTVLTIPQPAGDDGRLFGSVTAQDIVDAIQQARGLKLDTPQGPARGADQDDGHAHGHGRGLTTA